MKNLRVKGTPLLVKTSAQRMNAHNLARDLGYLIETRRRIGSEGYEIHRVK